MATDDDQRASSPSDDDDTEDDSVASPDGVAVDADDELQVSYGPLPVHDITCPNCRKTVPATKLDHEPGFASYLTFMGLFVVGLWPLLWLPFCNITRLTDTYHRCPNCGVCLGRYKVLDLAKMCGQKASSAQSIDEI